MVRRIAADAKQTEWLLGASVALRGLASVGMVGIFLAFSWVLPFSDRARVAILIASLGTLAALLNDSLLPIFQARLAMHWPYLATISGRLVTLALTYGVVAGGLGFTSFVWASVIGQAATLGATVWIVLRVLRLRVRPRIDFPLWRSLGRSAIVLGLAVSIGQIYFRIDGVLLALLRSPREVGLYGAGYKFLELAEIGPAAILTSIFPTMSGFVRQNDARLLSLAQRAFDAGVAVAVPATVLGITFAPELIRLSAGDHFARGAPALQILAPFLLATFALTPALGLLLASECDGLLFKVNLALLALNVALNLILIPQYGFKAAAATSLASEVLGLVALTIAARRRTGFLPSLRGLQPLVLATGAMIAVLHVAPGPALVVAVLGGAAYIAAVLVVPGTFRDALGQIAGR